MMLQGFDCQRCLSSGSVWIHAKRPCYDACGSPNHAAVATVEAFAMDCKSFLGELHEFER